MRRPVWLGLVRDAPYQVERMCEDQHQENLIFP